MRANKCLAIPKIFIRRMTRVMWVADAVFKNRRGFDLVGGDLAPVPYEINRNVY